MKKTLNNLIDIFKYFADQHLMLNSFSFGELSAIGMKEETNIKFPLLHCQIDSSSIDKTWRYFTFNCLCMDKVEKDESNSKEVLSDSEVILNQLFNYLNLTNSFHKDFIVVEDRAELFPFRQRFHDEVTGWNLRITIKLKNTGACDIPFKFNFE